MDRQMRHKILTPKNVVYFIEAETRQEALFRSMIMDGESNIEEYENFDQLVKILDLHFAPQVQAEAVPSPKPASGRLAELEDRTIIRTKKYHTDESLAMSMEICKLIDHYKTYGYMEHHMDELENKINGYLRIRPI